MYKLKPLPYEYGALEPYIDTQTMMLHHKKHQQAYVDGLNTALAEFPDLQKKTLDDLLKGLDRLPDEIQEQVRYFGGGVKNHEMFWDIMVPGGPTEPEGMFLEAIEDTYGNLEELIKGVISMGLSKYGAGWAWLVIDKDGSLICTNSDNQDNPIIAGQCPLLGIDVWEHAYYLKYQNRRQAYLEAWWNVVNWAKVGEKYEAERGSQ